MWCHKSVPVTNCRTSQSDQRHSLAFIIHLILYLYRLGLEQLVFSADEGRAVPGQGKAWGGRDLGRGQGSAWAGQCLGGAAPGEGGAWVGQGLGRQHLGWVSGGRFLPGLPCFSLVVSPACFRGMCSLEGEAVVLADPFLGL